MAFEALKQVALETHRFCTKDGMDGRCVRCARKQFEGSERTHDSTRCLKCPGCLEYAKQKAAFSAASSEARDAVGRFAIKSEDILNSWRAYEKEHEAELRCAVVVER